MSSSTMADTSSALPATRAESRLTATGWLRVALIAALCAAAVSIAFDLVVAERVVDRAVALESTHASAFDHAPLAVPEPFSRRAQRGGLVLGELLVAGGIAFLLAGAATMLSPRSRSPLRLWILAGTAGLVGVVALPGPRLPAAAAGRRVRPRDRRPPAALPGHRGARDRRGGRGRARGVALLAWCRRCGDVPGRTRAPRSGASAGPAGGGHGRARAAGGVPRGVDREPGPVLGRAHRGRRLTAAPPGVA